jgi:hypothetical protein
VPNVAAVLYAHRANRDLGAGSGFVEIPRIIAELVSFNCVRGRAAEPASWARFDVDGLPSVKNVRIWWFELRGSLLQSNEALGVARDTEAACRDNIALWGGTEC